MAHFATYALYGGLILYPSPFIYSGFSFVSPCHQSVCWELNYSLLTQFGWTPKWHLSLYCTCRIDSHIAGSDHSHSQYATARIPTVWYIWHMRDWHHENKQLSWLVTVIQVCCLISTVKISILSQSLSGHATYMSKSAPEKLVDGCLLARLS